MMSAPASLACSLPVALRDTALTVTGLAGHATPDPFSTLRAKCQAQIEQLRIELRAAGHPRDVIEDAAYAQCALLDEAALSHLRGGDRDAWEREPLQVSEFQSHDAGDELIARIEQRLAQPQPVLPLLAIFIAVLDLGFKGKFALDGNEARSALMQALDTRLGRADEQDTAGTVLVMHGRRGRWFGHLSPLAWVAIATIAAALVYVALDQWLTAAIAPITR
jgi:type VI secretion system protein ImpK